MKRTIRKLFWVWQFDMEEKWLNEMAAKGLVLCGVSFCKYVFEECQPGEYAVKLELLENAPYNIESANYITFLEGMGVEYIGSVTRWAYFRKKTCDGPFNLYSDAAGRIKHLERIMIMLGTLALSQSMISFGNALIYAGSDHVINLLCSILCATTCALLVCGFFKIKSMRDALKKEARLYE